MKMSKIRYVSLRSLSLLPLSLSFFLSSFLLFFSSPIPILNQTSSTQIFPSSIRRGALRFAYVIFVCPSFLFLFFFSSLVRIFVSFFQGRGPRSFVFVAEWTNHGTRTYNNLITFPPCRYRDNNYALMARGWNDIMHPLKARKRHCFDASVSH